MCTFWFRYYSWYPGKENNVLNIKTVPWTLIHFRVKRLKLILQCTDFDALDGNGQLFLCLQDLAMDKFTSLLRKALPGSDRKTVMIIVSDEEWDCKNLENAFGSGKATPESVCKVSIMTLNAHPRTRTTDTETNKNLRLFTLFTMQSTPSLLDQTNSTIKTKISSAVNSPRLSPTTTR